jgi:hypothetical protein
MFGRWDKEPNGCYDMSQGAACCANECDVGSTRWEGQLDVQSRISRTGLNASLISLMLFMVIVILTYTCLFWDCRKALFMCEERADDIPKLLQFFRTCKRANEYFYCDAQMDKKTGELRNIFWSHVSHRAECRDFGDVITFDTTHKTNKHRMPLAMFVGLNHQLQNVIFGQTLLRDESSESFEWLFSTFKTCMGGRAPHVLLTGEHY